MNINLHSFLNEYCIRFWGGRDICLNFFITNLLPLLKASWEEEICTRRHSNTSANGDGL